MKRTIRILALVGAATVALSAAPVSAGETTTTFTIEAAGGLAVSAPTGTVDLGTGSSGGGTVSGQLGAVTVTDGRGTLLGAWTASVTSSDFTTGDASENETIGNDLVSYWSGAATAESGTAVRVPGQLTGLLAEDLGESRTAFSATGSLGNTSTTWNPTVVVAVPASVVVGTYTGTITHSVG